MAFTLRNLARVLNYAPVRDYDRTGEGNDLAADPLLSTPVLSRRATRWMEREYLQSNAFIEHQHNGRGYSYRVPTGHIVVTFRDYRPGGESDRNNYTRLLG